MNVSFSSNRLTDSALVDSASGELVYELSRTPGLHNGTTLRDAQGKVVAAYAPGWLSRGEITYRGQTMKVSEWLVRKHLSSTRTFVAHNGRSYRWESGGARRRGGYQLLDCETGQLVARAHRGRTKLLSPSAKCNIDVTADGLPILDAIVLSFVICELMARRAEAASAASA